MRQHLPVEKTQRYITDMCVSRGFGIDEDFCVLVTTSMDKTLNVWNMYIERPDAGTFQGAEKDHGWAQIWSSMSCGLQRWSDSTCGFDYDALVWDIKALDVAPIIRLRGHRYPLRRCHFTNGRGITIDKQGWMKYWNLTTDLGAGQDRCLQTIHPKNKDWKPSSSVSLHPHKRLVFAAQKLLVFDTVRIRPKELPVCKVIYNDISMTIVGATGTTVNLGCRNGWNDSRISECMEHWNNKMILMTGRESLFWVISRATKCFNYLNGAMMKDVVHTLSKFQTWSIA